MTAPDLKSRQLFLKKKRVEKKEYGKKKEYGHSIEQIRDNIDKATSFSDKMQPTKSAQFPSKERFLVCPFLPESMRKMALTSQTKFLESM